MSIATTVTRDDRERDDMEYFVDRFMTLLKEESGIAALDFYNNNKQEYFANKKHFEKFFELYNVQDETNLRYGEFHKALFTKVFERLLAKLTEAYGKKFVALKLTKGFLEEH